MHGGGHFTGVFCDSLRFYLALLERKAVYWSDAYIDHMHTASTVYLLFKKPLSRTESKKSPVRDIQRLTRKSLRNPRRRDFA